MKNLEILICENSFFSLASLREARHSISRNIYFFIIKIDLKVISRELLSLANLTRSHILDIYKLTMIIIINKDKDLIFIAFQVVALSFKGFKNIQKFFIINVIPNLCNDYFLKEKVYCISLTNFQKIWIQIFVDYVIRKKSI